MFLQAVLMQSHVWTNLLSFKRILLKELIKPSECAFYAGNVTVDPLLFWLNYAVKACKKCEHRLEVKGASLMV